MPKTPVVTKSIKHPMEAMIIGYDFNGHPFIMHCQGPQIEDVAMSAGTALANYVTVEKNVALAGQVQVYEVSPMEDDEGISFDGGTWRQPMAMEWVAIWTGAYLGLWKGKVGEGARYRETILRKTASVPKEEE